VEGNDCPKAVSEPDTVHSDSVEGNDCPKAVSEPDTVHSDSVEGNDCSNAVSESDTVPLDTIAGYKANKASTEQGVLQVVEFEIVVVSEVGMLLGSSLCRCFDLDSRFSIALLLGSDCMMMWTGLEVFWGVERARSVAWVAGFGLLVDTGLRYSLSGQ
jgi:hypothetical protein